MANMCDSPPTRTDHETAPAAHTYYFDIPLGGKLPHSTGVFFPDKYQAGGQVDLIVYLGGTDFTGTLQEYWSSKSTYKVRESVNDSQRNFLLVAPTVSVQGKPKHKFTTVGELADNPKSYLEQVICGISQEDPYQKGWKANNPSVGKIVVAGHSGGGYDLPKLVSAINGSKVGRLCECWGFDCLYYDNLADWEALAKSGVTIYHYYLKRKVYADGKMTCADTTTSLNGEDLKQRTRKLPNIKFIELCDDGGQHYYIPAKHLKERIQSVACSQ
jgi:hypothetical protein